MNHAGKLLTKVVAARSLNRSFVRTQMCTPPRVRFSFAEKVVHGILFSVAIWAVPAYISVNVKHYRGPVE